MSHVPCPGDPGCGSSDAGFEYDDGHVYCHKCGAHSGKRAPDPAVRRAHKKLLMVDYQALKKRKLGVASCKKFGYGVATFNGRPVQVAPYHTPGGDLVAQKVRFPTKEFTVLGDLKRAGLFGQHLWRDRGNSLTITEGELDAVSVSQAWRDRWPVVSVPTGSGGAARAVLDQLEWVEGFEKVVLCFDMDEPGRAAAREVAELLSPGKARIVHLPLKDANEMIVADRADELVQCWWDAKEHRPDGVLVGDEILEEALRWEVATEESIPFQSQALQTKMMGWRAGEITIICAATATGKTTWCHELARELLEAGQRVGRISLEEPVRDVMLGTLTAYLDRPLRFEKRPLNKPEVLKQWAKIKDSMPIYHHAGRLDARNVREKINYMAKAQGCSFVFLDNLSIVVGGTQTDNERQTIDNLMQQLVSLTSEVGLSVIIVCHLRRPDKGTAHTEGRRISLADLRGSGMLEAMANNVMALERNQMADDGSDVEALVRVLKCRHSSRLGDAGVLVYNRDTGRLLPAGESFGPIKGDDL